MLTRRWFVISIAAGLVVASVGRSVGAGMSGSATAPRAVGQALTEPRLFAEGVVSTSNDEAGISFTPDGRTAYFTVISPGTLSPALQVICVTRLENGKWSSPEIAPFSGQYRDAFPSISPDGSKFLFASLRPVDGTPKTDFDLWMMERTRDGWSEPRHLGAPVNGPGHDLSPSIAANGSLYFASVRPGGKVPGVPAVFRSRLIDGRYAAPEPVGDAINTIDGAIDPLIAPDESFLVFASSGSDELFGVHASYNRGDLYISDRKNGAWTARRHLPAPLNSGGAECCPSLSPDRRQFFFTSDRGFATHRLANRLSYSDLMARLKGVLNGRGNIYQIDSAVLRSR